MNTDQSNMPHPSPAHHNRLVPARPPTILIDLTTNSCVSTLPLLTLRLLLPLLPYLPLLQLLTLVALLTLSLLRLPAAPHARPVLLKPSPRERYKAAPAQTDQYYINCINISLNSELWNEQAALPGETHRINPPPPPASRSNIK